METLILPCHTKNFLRMLLFLIFVIQPGSAQPLSQDYHGIVSTDSIIVEAGWNLLSLPLVVTNGIKSTLFPSATSQAFIYENSYLSKDTLQNGYGFWLKFDSDEPIPISGELIYINTIDVRTGWNIIGSLSRPAPVDSITTIPPGIIVSGFFGYAQGIGYQETDTIQPGFGYWVKVGQDGYIILHSDSGKGGGKPCVGIPTVEYEGKTYNTVQIGTQCWLKENLDIGTRINGDQNQTNNGVIEKYCYNDDPEYCDIFGGLYQWDEAMRYSIVEASQGICPSDWHIPAYVDIETLKVAVNNSSNALKAIGQGEGAGAGTNMSGFSGLLAGYRTDYATFNGYGIVEYFWSSRTLTFPDYFALLNTSNSILSYFIYPANGFNVRCVRYVDTTNHPPTYPINPVPGDLATQLPTLIKLEWDCNDIDGDALKYDVFFGKDNPPATKIASNRIDDDILASYLGPLNESTTYFWKVIAKDSHGDSTIGNIWRFTTGSWGTPCTGIPTVEYEGKTYHTVQLGSQCWLKENLDVGIRIDNSSNQTDNGTIEKYCGNNLVEYCNLYGGFYEWYEAMQYTTTPGVRGICPLGWHIPTLGDFETLSTTVGGDANALKAVGQATGTNTSGFSALLAGFVDDYWYNQGSVAYFWSSTYYESPTARFLELFYDHSDIAMPATNIVYGFSIRCLKD